MKERLHVAPAIVDRDQGSDLAVMIEASDDAILSKSLDGIIRSWNPAAERLYGYSAREAVGESVRLILPPDRIGEETAILERLRTGDRINHFETVRRRKDGTLVNISLSVSPLFDPFGKIADAMAVGRDITERVDAEARLREAEKRYRTTLDSLMEGFQIIDSDWTYLYANPAVAAHGRRATSALVGRRMMDVYPGLGQTEMFAVLEKCMRERTSAIIENEFTCEDGSRNWFELRIEPVPEGLCIHSIDIQARKEMESALREMNRELDARVADRTRELEAVNRELEAFSYSVSHDLRAPLRSLDGFSQVLMEDHAGELSEGAQDALRRIRKASQRMGEMIDDLIRLSRVTRGKLQVERVSLSVMARDIAEELKAGSVERKGEFLVQDGLDDWADASLLRMVLQNLLDNAWKYTRPRAETRIEFDVTSIDGRPAY